MAKWLLLIIGIWGAAIPVRSQAPQPVQAPDDVLLEFKVANQREFRLGELIPFSYSYSSRIRDRYIYVSQSKKLEGGRDLQVNCSPEVEHPRRPPSFPSDVLQFEKMLNANCGIGVGGGIGGGCFNCDWEHPLTSTPIGFGFLPLNAEVRFRNPGTYSCVASSATVTTAAATEKIRSALLLQSAPVRITIIADPAWSRVAASTYSDAFRHQCLGEDVPQERFLTCSDLAQRITYLDTRESLAAEVHLYDGRNHGWDNGFWDAIQLSSYPDDALRLMTERIQQPDFQVSEEIVKSLAVWDLEAKDKAAFQSTDPALYHLAAVENLRKYLRILGGSLPSKEADVLVESKKTYRRLAERNLCVGEALIPSEEQSKVLAAVPKN